MQQPYEKDKLRALLEEKLAALKRYQSLTSEMKAITPRSDLGRLNSLVFDRQKYMRKIQAIDRTIDSMRQTQHQKPKLVNSSDFNELYDRYQQDYRHIMEAITPMDEKIFFMVQRESEKIKTELLAIKNNKQAVSRYGSNKINVSKYLDAKH